MAPPSSVWNAKLTGLDPCTLTFALNAKGDDPDGSGNAYHLGFSSYNADWYSCALDGGRVVSFCLVGEFLTVERGGRTIRIGGPGCVGTVPDHRRRGIGLKLVENATLLLKQEGFDYSWIHYTGVAPWYRKLGYRPVLRWNRSGFLPEV